MAKSTKAKAKTTKKSLKQRLAERKAKITSGGGTGFILKLKEEKTYRIRILPVGEDKEFYADLVSFYLGNTEELGEVISPSTFGDPCALLEAYNEYKSSKSEEDKTIAKELVPRNKTVLPIVMYEDEKGKTIDEKNSKRLLQVTGGVLQEIIDLYLDEDEGGDMTDPRKGYDLKITRTGKGMKDTKYSVRACKPTALPKEYWKEEFDLDAAVKEQISSYDETATKLESFLGTIGSDDDDDEDDTPKKSKKKKSSKGKSTKTKKKRKTDI